MYRHVGPKTRYQMREKLASIGDDSWIEDDGGNKVFKVNGKAMHIRDTFVLEDADGNEVAKIQERKLHVRNTMAIERDGKKVATVHRRIVGLRDHLRVEIEDGPDMKVHGNLVDHEYEIEGEHGKVAEDLEEVVPAAGHVRRGHRGRSGPRARILAITVAVEDLTHEEH